MSLWSNEELSLLKENFDKTPLERWAAYQAEFGRARTFDAVERKVRRMRRVDAATKVLTAEIEEEVQEFEEELESINGLGTRLSPQEIGILSDHLGGMKKASPAKIAENRKLLNEFIKDVIHESSQQEFSPIIIPQNGSSLCVLLSDTHIGKHTDAFNSEIFIERLLSIPDKILKELAIPEDLEEVVFMLAGDMLEGENIYETQAHHIEFPVIDQIKIATETFWQLGQKTKAMLNVKVRFVTCPGNHGRVSKLASEKSNFDNIIYQTLSLIASASKDEDVSVEVNFEPFFLFPVQDKVGMIFHHGTKHLGTPAMQSKVSGWIYTKNFDFMCHGHWHQWEVGTQFGRPVMKNGSLPGQDDLAERMGVFDPPRQGWLLIRKGLPINQMGYLEW